MRFLAVAVLAVSAVFTLDASVHTGNGQEKRDWKDVMKAEKIAFLSSELDLSPEEAEKFWPLYNLAEEERHKAMEKVMETYTALSETVGKKASDKEISSRLDAYCKAVEAANSIDSKYIPKYKKVISAEKVARLFLSEEKFRRQQISRFHKGPKQGAGRK